MNSLPAHNFSQFLKRFTKEYGSSCGCVTHTYPVSLLQAGFKGAQFPCSPFGVNVANPKQGSKGQPPLCGVQGVPEKPLFLLLLIAAGGEQKRREHAIISLYFRNKKEVSLMPLSARFEEALIFATRLHAQQTRKGTTIPYIAHLLAVAGIVLENGGNEDEAIAALLHDAIEDQGGAATREEIRRRFGNAVVAIVDGCTDAEVIPKPPWRARKETYIAHIRQAPASVRLVSAADKLHNARAILADYRLLGEFLWKRFNGGKDGTLWYYRSLLDAFRTADTTPLIEELDRVVSELEELVAEKAQ